MDDDFEPPPNTKFDFQDGACSLATDGGAGTAGTDWNQVDGEVEAEKCKADCAAAAKCSAF